MPDFLNQIQIKGSTYSIYDSRLTENNGAIVAAETVYIGTKADANALQTASQVASAIGSAMSSIATDRITSGSAYLNIYSNATIHLGDGENEVTVARLTSTGTLDIGGGAVQINGSNSTYKFADIVSTMDGGEGNTTVIGTSASFGTDGAGIAVENIWGSEAINIRVLDGEYAGGKGIYVTSSATTIGTLTWDNSTGYEWSYEDIATQPWVSSAINQALTDTMTYRQAVTAATSPISAVKGDVFAAASAFTVSGERVEVGDMIIAKASIASGASFTSSNVDIIQKNIDGAVTGPASATANHVAVFDGNTGKVIKDGTYTIAKSVPSDALFTDANVAQTSSLSVLSASYPILFKTSTGNTDVTGSVAFNSAITYNPGNNTLNLDGGNIALGAGAVGALTAQFQSVSAQYINGVEVGSDPKFTDTTYSAGTGLSLSGTTINHTNSITAGSAGISTAQSGTTFSVPYVAYDAQGHITSAVTAAVTIPVMGGASATASGTAGLVPAPSAGHEGEFLRADGTWSAPTFTVPAANANTLGGIKLGYSTVASLDYYAVQADENNNAYVAVHGYGAGEGLSLNSSTRDFSVIAATSSTFGGIKLGYNSGAGEDGFFPVQLDGNGKAYVYTYALGSGFSSSDGIVTVPTFSGATSQATGTSGLVPSAASSQYATAFLKADGTWAETATVSGNTLIL